jgi:hypothetical protein
MVWKGRTGSWGGVMGADMGVTERRKTNGEEGKLEKGRLVGLFVVAEGRTF